MKSCSGKLGVRVMRERLKSSFAGLEVKARVRY